MEMQNIQIKKSVFSRTLFDLFYQRLNTLESHIGFFSLYHRLTVNSGGLRNSNYIYFFLNRTSGTYFRHIYCFRAVGVQEVKCRYKLSGVYNSIHLFSFTLGTGFLVFSYFLSWATNFNMAFDFINVFLKLLFKGLCFLIINDELMDVIFNNNQRQ